MRGAVGCSHRDGVPMTAHVRCHNICRSVCAFPNISSEMWYAELDVFVFMITFLQLELLSGGNTAQLGRTCSKISVTFG